MPRLSILNFVIGFCVLGLSSASGVFLANDITAGFIKDPAILNGWELSLHRSAHGHTNLFGMLHVLMGLTFPYSVLGASAKKFQTMGLAAGTAAMSIGLFIKGLRAPNFDPTVLDVGIGIALSLALLAVGMHIFGLTARLMRP